MKENYVSSQYSETWLENGIIVQNINPTVKEVNLTIARQLIADRKTAAGSASQPFPVLVFTNNAINIQHEAKQFYESEEPYVNITGIAMVMDNYIASFVARLVFIIKKNKVPTEVFNNVEKAKKWLEKYKSISA